MKICAKICDQTLKKNFFCHIFTRKRKTTLCLHFVFWKKYYCYNVLKTCYLSFLLLKPRSQRKTHVLCLVWVSHTQSTVWGHGHWNLATEQKKGSRCWDQIIWLLVGVVLLPQDPRLPFLAPGQLQPGEWTLMPLLPFPPETFGFFVSYSKSEAGAQAELDYRARENVYVSFLDSVLELVQWSRCFYSKELLRHKGWVQKMLCCQNNIRCTLTLIYLVAFASVTCFCPITHKSLV